jgi:hypothetical protein
MQPDALVNGNGDPLEGEDASRDEYREAEAVRGNSHHENLSYFQKALNSAS